MFHSNLILAQGTGVDFCSFGIDTVPDDACKRFNLNNNDRFADKEDCSRFYYCRGNNLRTEECRDGTQFDMIELTCKERAQARCLTDCLPISTVCNRQSPCTVGEQLPDPDPMKCNIYYECVTNPTTQQTEWKQNKCFVFIRAMVFSPEQGRCIAGETCDVYCPETTVPPPKPTTLPPTTEEDVVTTVAETTVAPTTVAETTEAPTTVAETTVAPTTVAETTVAPTTVAETTVAPTTEAEITEAPTTVAKTTEAPTTVAKITEAPTTEAETTVAPTTLAETTVAITTVAETTIAPTMVAETTTIPTTNSETTEKLTTKSPVKTTEPDEETTAAPAETTVVLPKTTAAPVETTAAPAETTVASAETTAAPAETTVAPAETTGAPAEKTTGAPAETTLEVEQTTKKVPEPQTTETLTTQETQVSTTEVPVSTPCNPELPCIPGVKLANPRSCSTYFRCDYIQGSVTETEWNTVTCVSKTSIQKFDIDRYECVNVDDLGRDVLCQPPCDTDSTVATPGDTTTTSGGKILHMGDSFHLVRSCPFICRMHKANNNTLLDESLTCYHCHIIIIGIYMCCL